MTRPLYAPRRGAPDTSAQAHALGDFTAAAGMTGVFGTPAAAVLLAVELLLFTTSAGCRSSSTPDG